MTTKLIGAGAAVAVLHWGLHCPFWVAVFITAGGMVWIWRPAAAGKTIFVMDQATGQMTPQPLDRAGERYLNTRKES